MECKNIITEEIMYKDRCRDCVCLVEKCGMWYCDEAEEYCSEIEYCPENISEYYLTQED